MGPRIMITPGSGLEEAPELLGARRMPELAERLGFDLTDTLPGDREVLADLLQRRQRVQHLVGLLTQGEADHALDGRAHLLVLDEVAQMAVLLLADGRLE